MNKIENKDYYNEIHNQIIGWTSNCDTKSSIIIAFVGVLVSIVFTSEYLLGTIENQIENIVVFWRNDVGKFSMTATLMFLTLLGFLIQMSACFYYAIQSLKANTECSDDSILFFGKIVDLSKGEYIDKVINTTDEEYQKDKLSQIYNCATICNDKFKCYNKSISHLIKGLLLFVGFMLFVIILKSL